jgi:hypothetical protein
MIHLDVIAEIKPEKKTEFILTINQIIDELKKNILTNNVKTSLVGEKENLFNARFSLQKENDYDKFCISEEYAALTGSLKILCKSYSIESTKSVNKHNILIAKESK